MRDSLNFAVTMLKLHQKGFTNLIIKIMSKKDTDRIANSEDPFKTASLGTVWCGSALFDNT